MAEASAAVVKALRASQRARRLRHKKPIDPVIDPVLNRLEAEKAEVEANELLRPPERLQHSGNEVVRVASADEVLSPARLAMLDTLGRHAATRQRAFKAFGEAILGDVGGDGELGTFVCNRQSCRSHPLGIENPATFVDVLKVLKSAGRFAGFIDCLHRPQIN